MRKTPAPSGPQLWTVLAKSHREISRLVERSIADLGLCLSDFMVIEALLHKGPLTITAIQEKVLLATGSMTAAVDRVEKSGLIVRKLTPTDRRARLLELTPKGRRVAETAYRGHAKDLDRLTDVLQAEERHVLYGALKKLGKFAAQKLRDDTQNRGHAQKGMKQ
jgi:MarR family transcriptional regulator, 2-MHQ and catechol-resistance regulon repressor